MLLAFSDALEPIPHRLRQWIGGIVELDFVLFSAVLETKCLGAHVGDLQSGFQRMLKTIQLVGQAEQLLNVRILQMQLNGIVVGLGFLISGVAITLYGDRHVFGNAGFEVFRIEEAGGGGSICANQQKQ